MGLRGQTKHVNDSNDEFYHNDAVDLSLSPQFFADGLDRLIDGCY